MSTNKDSEIKQLVLAKGLFLHGCGHAARKDIVSRMVAIHNFDNAIEMVLKCVAVKQGITPKTGKYFNFPDLVKKIDDVPLREQVNRLHDVRNMVQHQGEIPSLESVLAYKGYTDDFFKQVCNRVFNISYDQLYLSQLVENERLREHLLEAEQAFEKEDFKQCIVRCDGTLIAATFDEADLFSQAGMLTGYWGAGEGLRVVLRDDYLQKYEGKDYYDLAKELRGAILQWGQAATGMQFLGEYKTDFLRYRQIAETCDALTGKALNEGAEFCLTFVTGLILKWQEEGLLTAKGAQPSSS